MIGLMGVGGLAIWVVAAGWAWCEVGFRGCGFGGFDDLILGCFGFVRCWVIQFLSRLVCVVCLSCRVLGLLFGWWGLRVGFGGWV